MFTVSLSRPDDIDGWRDAARAHLAAATAPENIVWQVASASDAGAAVAAAPSADLFAADHTVLPPPVATQAPPVPRSFLDLAERVICHSDPTRFALLYRVLFRRAWGGEPDVLRQAADTDMHTLHLLGKCVARERHKMHAFVRFRQSDGVDPEHFYAWFEPEHHTLRLSVPFFVRRFANMRWSIVTPAESAHWDTRQLVFGPGGRKGAGPGEDAMEDLWRVYFANIFNPARLMVDAMTSEMPVKYWKNLPEAPLIQQLVLDAGARASAMVDAEALAEPRFAAVAEHPHAVDARGIPVVQKAADGMGSLGALHAQTRACLACPHAHKATQTVNGEGRVGASLVIVGEQAGDVEDLSGRPFAGPAGEVLRGLLKDADIDTQDVFLTNAVRHFHYEVRGKRRLHKLPDKDMVDRCRQHLFQEIKAVGPQVVLLLGATAGRALRGRAVRVTEERGVVSTTSSGVKVVQSIHPAAVLRADGEKAASLKRDLQSDIALAWRCVNAAVAPS